MYIGGIDISLDTFEMIGFARVGAITKEDMKVSTPNPLERNVLYSTNRYSLINRCLFVCYIIRYTTRMQVDFFREKDADS